MGNVSQNLLAKSPRDIAIPSIVLFELEVGIAKSRSPKKRIKQLHEIISVVNVIGFGEEEAKTSAAIRAKLEKVGTPIGSYDVLIAGTALAQHATLVSHNLAEFDRVEKLKVEDWF